MPLTALAISPGPTSIHCIGSSDLSTLFNHVFPVCQSRLNQKKPHQQAEHVPPNLAPSLSFHGPAPNAHKKMTMAATETRKKKTLVHISAHTYHLNILKQQPCECPSSGFYKLSHPYWRPDSLKQNQHRL